MASSSAGSLREARDGAPDETTKLDKMCEKALAASANCRWALAAVFYQRAADEELRLHGETFVCTFLTLRRSFSLLCQAGLEGVTREEQLAFEEEARALASSVLPFIIRRMDANTMLPGRGTALELAFFKRYLTMKQIALCAPLLPTYDQQRAGLSLGYNTAVLAADVLLMNLCSQPDVEAQAYILRVVDCMLPTARSLPGFALADEKIFVSNVQKLLSGDFVYPTFDAAFIASLRAKWTAAAMVQMRRARNLLNAREAIDEAVEDDRTRWRADVAQHGLKECALPSCDKREASVQQYKCCSACRSVWYCSEEHGALHWKEHKPICRATTAAQQFADDAGAGVA